MSPAGVADVTLATVLPSAQRLCHVGINQTQAGCVAWRLMGNMLTSLGEVIMNSGRTDYVAHRQRITGFRDVMTTLQPAVRLQDVLAGDDKDQQIVSLLQAKLTESPNIVGIYNTGAGGRSGDAKVRHCWAMCLYYTSVTSYRPAVIATGYPHLYPRSGSTTVGDAVLTVINYLESQQRPELDQSSKVELNIYMAENCAAVS